MFTKALIVCAVAAVALAAEYPPGIHPALCPNYPYCDMELLARYTPQGLPASGWEWYPYARMAYYPYGPYPIFAKVIAAPVEAPADAPIEAPVETPAVEPAKYPADFDPALCPNYPFCT